MFCTLHTIFHMWHPSHVKRATVMYHCQPCLTLWSVSARRNVCTCVCVCVRQRESICVCQMVFSATAHSAVSRGCCCGVLVLPWAAYEKAPVLITWSTRLLIRHTPLKWHLLITPSLFRNSFLDFIQPPSCSLSCRNKQVGCCGSHSLFDWKWVSKHTNRHLKSL